MPGYKTGRLCSKMKKSCLRLTSTEKGNKSIGNALCFDTSLFEVTPFHDDDI